MLRDFGSLFRRAPTHCCRMLMDGGPKSCSYLKTRSQRNLPCLLRDVERASYLPGRLHGSVHRQLCARSCHLVSDCMTTRCDTLRGPKGYSALFAANGLQNRTATVHGTVASDLHPHSSDLCGEGIRPLDEFGKRRRHTNHGGCGCGSSRPLMLTEPFLDFRHHILYPSCFSTKLRARTSSLRRTNRRRVRFSGC